MEAAPERWLTMKKKNLLQGKFGWESFKNMFHPYHFLENLYLVIVSLYRMERCKSRLDRLSSIVITAKSGVKNLQEKLENIGKELNVEKIVFDESDPVSSVWSAGTILVELVARTRERDMSELLEEKNSENDEIRSLEENNNSETICRPFNQRVSLPSAKDGTLFDEFDDDDDNFGDIDDEELSRDRVKKASSQIIRAQKRKKAKEKNQ
jgi:hypothetical protein